jgi:hypothetical protein
MGAHVNRGARGGGTELTAGACGEQSETRANNSKKEETGNRRDLTRTPYRLQDPMVVLMGLLSPLVVPDESLNVVLRVGNSTTTQQHDNTSTRGTN